MRGNVMTISVECVIAGYWIGEGRNKGRAIGCTRADAGMRGAAPA